MDRSNKHKLIKQAIPGCSLVNKWECVKTVCSDWRSCQLGHGLLRVYMHQTHLRLIALLPHCTFIFLGTNRMLPYKILCWRFAERGPLRGQMKLLLPSSPYDQSVKGSVTYVIWQKKFRLSGNWLSSAMIWAGSLKSRSSVVFVLIL